MGPLLGVVLRSASLAVEVNLSIVTPVKALVARSLFFGMRRGKCVFGKFLALPALIAALLSVPSSAAAQVSINIGLEPVCPYGYYDFAPYNCAPYGYYGPDLP
jgi:hypothetical protein